jgi:hypothetical protein
VLLSTLVNDAPPNSLKDSNVNLKMETMEEKRVRVHSLACSISKVKMACQNFGIGTRTNDKRVNYSYQHAPTKQQVG